MPPELGAGWALDENWDFVIGPGGDFLHSDGLDELLKDLAVRLEPVLSDYLGTAISRGEFRDMQIDVVGVIEDDPRIDTVQNLRLSQVALDEVEVAVTATTVGDNADLEDVVIPV